MGFINSKYVFVVAQKAAIRKSEKYLILKRSPNSRSYPGCWDFPGGKLEHEESSKKALEREVKEETGLKAKTLKPRMVFTEKINECHVVFIIFESKLISGKEKLSEEHSEFKWASKKEILKLKTEKYLREFLKEEK